MKEEYREENTTSSRIEGRHSVLEALRAGSLIERLFVQKGCQDGPVLTILREAKKADVMVDFVPKERLDFMSETKNHQGVVAVLSAFAYSTIDDMFALAEKKGEAPFFFLLDGIEDPHNLGAIIRTAEAAGAHGVIIPKRRGVGLTATVAKTSAGAVEYMPVVRVANIVSTIEELKQKGLWIFCADMDGQPWCSTDMGGPIGIVVGAEGSGVSRLTKEHCDFVVSLPMNGQVNSLNASVAAAIVIYEAVRQRNGLPSFHKK